MAELIGGFLGIIAVCLMVAAYVVVRTLVWAGLFYIGAWAFPGLEVWAQTHMGMSFPTIGAGFGLLTLALSTK